jgi:probable F420-dependent oxidoreductase
MAPLRITYGPWGESIAELVAAGRDAEAAGAEVLWLPELHRSATVTAAALAAGTERAQIGTAIALAFTRSPMITALEALDVDEISGGRFVLGLGTGVQRLNEDWHNARFGKPAPHIRETVRNLRAFWELAGTGATIDLPGEYEPMRIRGYQRPFGQLRPTIPIYLAAMGPIMTRLAGEIGDGWISHELISPAYLEQRILPDLLTGIERGGRARADLDVVVSALCAIDADGTRARRWAAGTVGFYASVRTYADFFDFHGVAAEQQVVIDAFRSGVGADYLGEAVPDSMVDAVTLAGTPDEVRERLSGYEGLADTVKLTPPTHGLPAEDTRSAQRQIIELIATLTGV